MFPFDHPFSIIYPFIYSALMILCFFRSMFVVSVPVQRSSVLVLPIIVQDGDVN